MGTRGKSNRRDFLQGKAALQAISEIGAQSLADASPDLALPGTEPDTYLLQFSRRAMACEFEILLNAGQYEQATEAALRGLDLVERLEDQMTVFREHSEISQLNRTAAMHAVEVEPRLFQLLEQAVRIHQETLGAYDVTAGPLSKVWGFTRRSGAIPDGEVLAAASQRVGSEQLELEPATSSVRFRSDGVEINLGSIGKGYALDRLAELLQESGIEEFFLHGGQSSVLARGSQGGDRARTLEPPTPEEAQPQPPLEGWRVGVPHPLRPKVRLGEIRLRNAALATSGAGTQFFFHNGQRFGHILDPRTGWPAQGVLSTTVTAPSAAAADALSTAFYVMGPERTRDYCRQHPELGCLMSCPGERAGSVEVHTFGAVQADWIPSRG